MAALKIQELPLLNDPGFAGGEAQRGDKVYEDLRALRAQSPFVRTEMGIVIALRHRHVEPLVGPATRQLETETKMMQGIVSGPIYDFTADAMLFANGDVHVRRRSPVSRTFAFKLMDAMRPRAKALAQELVAEHRGAGPIDFIEQIAAQIPARLIAEILGVPRADLPVFLRWIGDTAAALGFVDLSRRAEIEQSLIEFNAYVADLLADRRAAPRGDFISDYVAATAEAGNLTEAEIRTQVLGLILAGSDTTRGTLCMTLTRLLQHPAQWADFKADPDGLKKGVVEEGLRFDPLVSGIPRVAVEPFTVDGLDLAPGQVIFASLVSALRDPEVFAEPDTFNIRRTDHSRWHYAFGAGAHRCVGEALARVELEETLAVIAREAPNTELIGLPPTLGFGAIRPIDQMQAALS